jgi:hypothetical protein
MFLNVFTKLVISILFLIDFSNGFNENTHFLM